MKGTETENYFSTTNLKDHKQNERKHKQRESAIYNKDGWGAMNFSLLKRTSILGHCFCRYTHPWVKKTLVNEVGNSDGKKSNLRSLDQYLE